METKQTSSISVPWTAQDVWAGVVLLVLMILDMRVISYISRWVHIKISADALILIEFCVQELFILLPVGLFALHKYRVDLQGLGLRKFTRGSMGLGCGLMILLYTVIIGYSMLLAHFHLQVQNSISPLLAKLTNPWPFMIGGAFVAPFVEEVFFRGFVFAGLSSRYGWKISAGISSLLFAAAHLELTFLLPAFLFGYLFAYMYKRSNSIWPGIILHMCFNVLGMTALFLTRTGHI